MRVPVTVRLVMQEPALHVCPPPQAVPSIAGEVSTHTGAPEPHWMAAVAAHGFAEMQGAFGVQALQAPVAEQTRFGPQLVPALLSP